MKNIIVIVFSVMLAVYIFGMILGDHNSIRMHGQEIMQRQIQDMRITP